MKKKVLKMLCGTLAACTLFATPVFAEDYQMYAIRMKTAGPNGAVTYFYRMPDLSSPINSAYEYVGLVKFSEMYRLYNPNNGEHFYTANVGEKNYLVKIGWKNEGISWYAPEKSKHPIYRLYNPNTGDHHYTTNVGEKNYLVKIGWRDEGIGWYGVDSGDYTIYRQYNPNAKTGAHNYTGNLNEKDALVKAGWKDEGIAFEEEIINTTVAQKYGSPIDKVKNGWAISTSKEDLVEVEKYMDKSEDLFKSYRHENFDRVTYEAIIKCLNMARNIANQDPNICSLVLDIDNIKDNLPEPVEYQSGDSILSMSEKIGKALTVSSKTQIAYTEYSINAKKIEIELSEY